MLTEIALDQFLMDGILLKLTVQAKRLAKKFVRYNELRVLVNITKLFTL